MAPAPILSKSLSHNLYGPGITTWERPTDFPGAVFVVSKDGRPELGMMACYIPSVFGKQLLFTAVAHSVTEYATKVAKLKARNARRAQQHIEERLDL